ncbi:unnamed protein product [Parascedosporium putredinis]|uniref:Clathrin light chain n=1 Tax=Parascedosporium putredinis TaxID=1442378 RepID=A0A9P1GYE2_9PEZI|nr:unnamed protein product [Parascedosporium putredinis]CAI7989895.1 unnamed protein product [Parascedosporium putredinis]
MADRFPSLEEFDSGAEPSADDFLAREKALLGDDAEQFTTTQDSEAAGVGDRAIAQTRQDAKQFLANREDTVSGGTSWDRIAKLVDVSGKGVKGGAAGSGKERFRELLVTLRKDDKAPGAVGV